MSEPFSVVAADPAWRFGDSLPGPARGASKHYETMPVEDICALAYRLPPIAADALLFLWRVSSMVEEALRVVRAWGFRAVSEIVWVKTAASGKPRLGMGRYVRLAHEVCIIATRGSGVSLIQDHSIPSVISAPRGKHSAKPDAFYELVERLAVGPRLELFSRAARPGWTTIGTDLGSRLDLPLAPSVKVAHG